MNKKLYLKLAADNLKKNRQIYLPYLFTCIGITAMYTIVHSLYQNTGLDCIYGGTYIKLFMMYGDRIISVFSLIFLFYTNSFLIKRRKKEFGLYNILGMEKRHISQVLFWETFYVSVATLVLGIVAGALLSRGFFLFLLRIIHIDTTMAYQFPPKTIPAAVILFLLIHLLTYLNAVRQIHLVNPIELLRGSQVGEREPKTRLFMALLGFLALFGGYGIALTTQSPLTAIPMFFLAVILVIIGTYFLFIAGSIALLKILRRNKKYYYQTRHFTSVSGLIYRMKQNAVGLANICILSTAVLVMISTTISLYLGVGDVLRTRYPRNIVVTCTDTSPEQTQVITETFQALADDYGIHPENVVQYSFLDMTCIQEGSLFHTDVDTAMAYTSTSYSVLFFVPLSDYNHYTGKDIQLKADEILINVLNGDLPKDTVTFADQTFRIKERISDTPDVYGQLSMLAKTYCVIVPDTQTVFDIIAGYDSGEALPQYLDYYYGFDTEAKAEVQKEYTAAIQELRTQSGWHADIECAQQSKEDFYSLYGGFFFLGILLSLLFLLATILIIYYKQMSEGLEDQERFIIMQKVGMSEKEVKQSIHSQVFTVFFLPLFMAGIHIIFAFPIVRRLLALMNLTQTWIFIAGCLATFFLFALIYLAVYLLTARVYYRLVAFHR